MMQNNITVRTKLPEKNLLENMQLNSEQDLLNLLRKRILDDTQNEYTTKQVRGHFNSNHVRAIA